MSQRARRDRHFRDNKNRECASFSLAKDPGRSILACANAYLRYPISSTIPARVDVSRVQDVGK